ncbi:CYTH domain-containing protein [Streptococcus sp. 2A/TPW/M5]
MNHLEIEYKTLLDKEEYQSLLPLFADTELVVQTNHYIDTPDQLIRKEKMALRVRTFTDQAELTLKVPETVGHFEYNQALSPEETKEILQQQQFPDGEIKNLLESKESQLNNLLSGKPDNRTIRKRNSCRLGGTRPQSLSRH